MLTQVSPASPQPKGEVAWFREETRGPLLALLRDLAREGYDFVTATPASHARVVSRPDRRQSQSLRDVLGWSLPFTSEVIAPERLNLLLAAGAVAEQAGGTFKPLLRVSQVEGMLFLHSAYPTLAEDSVFLGPDSCRFAQLITARMQEGVSTVLDYGAGAGVGGIVAARHAGRAHLTLADVNAKALFLASINAEHAGLDHTVVQVAAPQEVTSRFDLMVTHPPFMIDAERRAYRDGGDLYGGQLSLEWVLQGVDLLAPEGRLILHTGASIVEGRDVLLDALRHQLPRPGIDMSYRELDPDIFSEELDNPQYAQVERIAAVGLVVTKV